MRQSREGRGHVPTTCTNHTRGGGIFPQRRDWTQGEKREKWVSGMFCASLPSLAQEDPYKKEVLFYALRRGLFQALRLSSTTN
eukprot:9329081-Pyramimonas_sp.AAC.1